MKIEEKLRSAMREHTESVRPDPSAWHRIDEGMSSRPPRYWRPAAMSLVAGAAILALLAVRLFADEPLGKVDITTPIPALPTTAPTGATSSPPSIRVQTVAGKWAAMQPPPTKDPFSTSAWTGREFLLWRGSGPELGNGLAYNPSTRRWRELPAFVVGGYFDAPAVWTGKEMIVWGGARDESGGDPSAPPPREGGAYNPTTDRWRRIAESPLYGGWDYQAVWTGAEMLVWGSRPQDDSIVHEFAAYNPSTDQWRELPTGPLGARDLSNVVWTGREMLVWGGASADGPIDGAAFDPGTENWRAIPKAPLSPRRLATAVWTGSELFVWGGQSPDESDLADGARYNPATNQWTKVAPAPLTPRHFASIVATPKGVFLWGGTGEYVEGETGPPYFNDGAVYDPKMDAWSTLPKAPLGPREGNAEVVYTGRNVIIWGGLTPYPDVLYSDGATFTFSE